MPDRTRGIVIVTGAGAPASIGRAIAGTLAQQGNAVVIADLNETTARDAAKEISDAGGTASFVALDVGSPASCTNAVQFAVAEYGQLTGLVNCAGIAKTCAFLDITEELWDATERVNNKGTFLMCQAAYRVMQDHGGAIVNLSSIAGKNGYPGCVHYAASKHAVIGITRSLARELGPSGVRVNAICPAAVKTDMWSAEVQSTDDPDAVLAGLVAQIPLGRAQTHDDISNAVSFLLSDAAASITGVSLSVDGGLLCD
jgi:NAD(P)-dependent dehydrogenase (short-subunit alcohol dehydrogenase family)